MGKKGKGKKKAAAVNDPVDSSEDEVVVKKGVRNKVLSESDDEQTVVKKARPKRKKRRAEVDDLDQEEAGQEQKKRKVLRCADSSDEDDVGPAEAVEATPKAERMKKLEDMRKKLGAKNAKKKPLYDTSSEDEPNEGPAAEDDENLPMWENEEAPPENSESDDVDPNDPDKDLQDFVVDDDDVQCDLLATRLPDSDSDDIEVEAKPLTKRVANVKVEMPAVSEIPRKSKKKAVELVSDEDEKENKSGVNLKTRKRKARKPTEMKVDPGEEDSSDEDEPVARSKRLAGKKCGGKKSLKKAEPETDPDSDEDEDDEEDSDGEEHINPYMVQGEDNPDMADIMAVLGRNTAQDKRNKRKYQKEVGKYQFAVHSSRNKAALIPEKVRFTRNMNTAKFDQGLKEDRNLTKDDPEYWNNFKEISAYGEAVRIFSTTRRTSRYKGRCALSGCGERFDVGDKVVGTTKLDPYSAKFVKKASGSLYYICAEHEPRDGDEDDLEEWPSGSSDDGEESDGEDGEDDGEKKDVSESEDEDDFIDEEAEDMAEPEEKLEKKPKRAVIESDEEEEDDEDFIDDD